MYACLLCNFPDIKRVREKALGSGLVCTKGAVLRYYEACKCCKVRQRTLNIKYIWSFYQFFFYFLVCWFKDLIYLQRGSEDLETGKILLLSNTEGEGGWSYGSNVTVLILCHFVMQRYEPACEVSSWRFFLSLFARDFFLHISGQFLSQLH